MLQGRQCVALFAAMVAQGGLGIVLSGSQHRGTQAPGWLLPLHWWVSQHVINIRVADGLLVQPYVPHGVADIAVVQHLGDQLKRYTV